MVNQSNIFKKIGYILNELQDQYEFLSENPDQLSELELELFLANANFLSDHVQIVKKLNGIRPIKELPQAAEQKIVAAPVEEVKEEQIALIQETLNNDPKDHVELEEVIADNHREEMVDFDEDNEPEENEIASLTEIPQDDLEDEVGPEPFLVLKEPIQPILVEEKEEVQIQALDALSVTAKPTINDLLAGHKSANINEDNSSPIITDLKKAVNLNEKLLYIKDLFNGYNLAYSEAIEILNKLPDFKAADTFLKNNYAVKNHWDAKPGTVEKFYDLLKQRFPGD